MIVNAKPTAFAYSPARPLTQSSRYPLIVEAARGSRSSRFVLDGEAVLLCIDGIADFNGLHSRRYDQEAQLYAFDILASMAMICASYRCISTRPGLGTP